MKRIIKPIYLAAVLVLGSCMDDITNLNTSPKTYSNVPGATLYTNAVRNLTDGITYGVTFKVLAQQWSETTYTDASRYNLPNVGNGFWNTMYRDVLADLKEARRLVELETGGFPEEKANKLALIDIMEVYSYSILINTFGDVPYTEALDYTNVHPAYDDALTIYQDLFNRLDADLAAMNPSFDSFGAQDLVYGGDVSMWIKFANSLRLRMAMTLSLSNNALAKTQAEKAAAPSAGGLISSNDENALFHYLKDAPNTNQIWVNLVQSGREDYVGSNTLVDMQKSLHDPRIPFFFTTDGIGSYSGGKFGVSNNFGNFSHAGEMVVDEEFPGTLLDWSETEFYLAEAVLRGYNVGGGTVEDHYNTAIAASQSAWGVEDVDFEYAIGAKVTAGGDGYEVGDELTIVGGSTSEAVFIVTSINDGDNEDGKGPVVTVMLKKDEGGEYAVPPSTDVLVTGGSGTGAKLNVVFVAGTTAYLARPDVAFTTAAGTDIQKIARQKYIAMYNRGLEAWTEYRRLDYPVLNTVPVPLGDFPIRYTYPVNEQNLNEESWAAAAAKIGSDDVTKHVFWDVN